jgi:hypothetical protein
MELLYEYLAGPEFKSRVSGIAESFIALGDDLEAEKRATQRHWARRERQLERALASTAGLYGDIEGIVGRGIAQVLGLDLPALEARAGEEEQ